MIRKTRRNIEIISKPKKRIRIFFIIDAAKKNLFFFRKKNKGKSKSKKRISHIKKMNKKTNTIYFELLVK